MRFQQGEGPNSRGTVKLGGGWLTPCDGVSVSALCNTTKPLLHYCLPPVVSVVSSQPPRSHLTLPLHYNNTASTDNNSSDNNTHSSFTLVIHVACENSEYPQPVVGYLNVLVIENNFHVKVSLTSSHYCYKN